MFDTSPFLLHPHNVPRGTILKPRGEAKFTWIIPRRKNGQPLFDIASIYQTKVNISERRDQVHFGYAMARIEHSESSCKVSDMKLASMSEPPPNFMRSEIIHTAMYYQVVNKTSSEA